MIQFAFEKFLADKKEEDMFKVKVEFELQDKFLGDILTTAFDSMYGGSMAWFDYAPESPGSNDSFKLEGGIIRQIMLVPKESLAEDDEMLEAASAVDGVITVDHEKVALGIRRILERDYPADTSPACKAGSSVEADVIRGVRDGDAGEIDSISAGAIIQVALFGKVVYG